MFFYDDIGNLQGLKDIVDLASFWQFVNSGMAGPLGRPVALFSFALQANYWPDPYAFLLGNVVIHAVNAILLFLIAGRILKVKYLQFDNHQLYWLAFTAVLLWAVLPLNISTSLISVQRMTSLSATFGLLGILVYLIQYKLYEGRSAYFAVVVQFGALAIFVLAGMFTKESAALIPVFILVLELTVLREQSRATPGRQLRIFILASAFLSIVFYLSPLFQDWLTVSSHRGFSRLERVTTEWVILWSYLQKAFYPLPSSFSPFHDDAAIVIDRGKYVLAGGAWLVVLISSYMLRKRSVWPLFAICWFLAGHLLESTSVSLELIFEHRNYLAIFGPCLAIVAIVVDLPAHFRRPYKMIFGAYLVLIIAACYLTTSLWGQPKLAAEMWSSSSPRSSRAALHLAGLHVDEENLLSGDEANSTETVRIREYMLTALGRTIAACPECVAVKMQAILLSCGVRGGDEMAERFSDALEFARGGASLRPLVDAIFPLSTLVASGRCNGITLSEVQGFIEAVRKNPRAKTKYYSSHLAYQAAEVAYLLGDFERAHRELLIGELIDPSAIPVLEMQVHLAIEQSDWAAARGAVARRRPYVSKGFYQRNRYLDKVLLDIEALVERNK
ncbi:MAG: hypothetical protein ACSHWQ_05050 [Spongiibacteraceae bacterium]